MSEQAPTPRLFGAASARAAQNPRPAEQMQPSGGGRDLISGSGGAGGEWWTQAPSQTTLATTTGQNLVGTSNAFDTNFWDRAAAQDAEQTSLLGRWDRPDATGVVTYDNEREGVEFGDVFVGGEKAGNVYRGYAGMTGADADEIMARLILPREVWAKAYETEAGRALTFTGNLSDEIAGARAQRSEDFAKGLSAAEFEGEVAERQAGVADSGAWQAGNVGAGVAGGAVAGAGAGALVGSVVPGLGTAIGGGVGAIVGAIGGGIGSWLNRDEAYRSYATAMEMWESATEDGHQAIGYADAAAAFGGAALGKLNVTRNLLHGGYEAARGEAGDGDVTYSDEQTPLWMQGADMAALLIDGVGSFGSKAARLVFTGLMGATTAAEQTSVVLGAADGNTAFNPYTGQYEDIGAGGMAQRQLSVGIDVAQTAAAGALNRLIGRARGATTAAQTSGGWVTTTVDGVPQATRLGFSALIPSEAATGIAARAMARRSLAAEGVEASRENLAIATARKIEDLTTGRKTIATAVVNGFGEGAEEFVQATLDATAYGETPTFRELVDAAKQGFAMGAGMGTALGVNSRSTSERYRIRANAMRAVRGQDEIADDEWSRLTMSEQAQLGTTSDAAEQRLYEQTVAELTRQSSSVAAANFPELRRAVEAARQIAQEEQTNSQELVEPARLQVRSNYEWAPEDYVVSLVAAIRDVSARMALMQRTAAAQPVRGRDGQVLAFSDEERRAAGQIAEAEGALLRMLQQAADLIEETPDAAPQVIEDVNRQLRAAWYARPEQDDLAFGKRRAASVLAARFPLNAAGSFQLLRLQVSPELTLNGSEQSNWTVLAPDEILAPTGGDYDGDRLVAMLREYLPEESFDALRYGAGQLTSDGTMIAPKPYLEAQSNLMFDVLAEREVNPLAYEAARQTRRMLIERVSGLLVRGGVPADVATTLATELADGLANRRPGALGDLATTLATQYAPAMRELALTIDGSPWLTLNRIVEDEMRLFQNAVALTQAERSSTGGTPLPATSKSMPRWFAQQQVPQTSDLLQGLTDANKYDVFRLQTVLKYNSLREPTQTTVEDTSDALADLIAKFTARNDGLVRPGEDAAFDGSLVQRRVLSWLRSVAQEYAQEFSPTITTSEAMVLLAGADVMDVDVALRRERSSKDVRLVQAMLREVLVQMRSEYAEVLGRDQAAQQRLGSLESLTTPDFMEGDHTHAQGGDAFVEVFGAFPLFELLGEQGANINTWTVRTLRDHLIELRGDVREEFVAALQRHPSYSTTDGVVSPYRVVVDNVVESARMQLSENRETGLPMGALNRTSETASRNFSTLHDALRKLARSRGEALSTPAEVRAYLQRDLRMANAVLGLLDDRGVSVATVRRERDGEIASIEFHAQWIYEVFAEPRTKHAEMMLLRHTLEHAKLAYLERDEAEPAKVGDRLLRLWLDLDYQASVKDTGLPAAERARDDFLSALTGSDTVDEFLSRINLDHRFRSEHTAPYMAWARDRSLVEASRFDRGVSSLQQGSTMRDALRDAAAAATSALQDEQAMHEYLQENPQLLAQLRQARDAQPGQQGYELWRRFTSWLDLAQTLPTMVGVSVWINQAGHINEILRNMGVKGIAPGNVAALGRALAAQLPSFDAAVGRMLSSMTSASLGTAITDPTQLARGGRTFVLNDGTVVRWGGVTPDQALALLSNPDTAGYAARMLGFTAWDYNRDIDTNVLVSTVGKGVAGFVADPEEALFGRDQNSKFRRLMTLEAMAAGAGSTPIIPLILATQMNIREAALDHEIRDTTGEREEIAVSILEDLADALDALSRMEGLYTRNESPLDVTLAPATDEETGESTTLLHQVILEAARSARRSSPTKGTASSLLSSDPELREIGYELLRRWAVKFSTAAVASGNDLLMRAAEKVTKELNAVDDYASPLDVVLSTYADHGSAEVRSLLVQHVQAAGEIATTAAWARTELLRVQDPSTPQVQVPIDATTTVTLPNLTAKEWETVARAVIAHTMHVSYGVVTRSDIEISAFPELSKADALAAQRAMWDPTFVEPMLEIFAPGIDRNPRAMLTPLLMSQLELVRTMGNQLPTVPREAAAQALARFVAPKTTSPEGYTSGVVGQWNALLPALMHSAQGAVLSAAAESGIQMAGLAPTRLAYMAATTRQEWSRRPADTELSTTTFPASQLLGAVAERSELSSQIDVTMPGAPAPEARVLAQLEGRVARQVGLTVAGERFSLLGDPRFSTGLLLPTSTGVLAGEGAVLSVATLSTAVTGWLRDRGIPTEQWDGVQVDVAFFHPDTKTVSATRRQGDAYDHNPWFDGVGGRTDAAFSQGSLVGSFFFGLDGAVPAAYERSLASIKKLTFALQQVTLMPETRRLMLTTNGLQDMAGMLDALTDFALRQKIDGSPLPLTSYNAIRKILSLLYVVRYVDENGQPQVLSAEQVIARQRSGEDISQLGNVQVIGLPMQHVLRLMGEVNGAELVTAPTGETTFTADVSRARPYTRFPAEAWTEIFPGFVAMDADGQWASADLLAQPELRNQALPRARVRSYAGQTRFASRDFFGPFRKHQEQVFAERWKNPAATDYWAKQRAEALASKGLPDANIGNRVLQAVQSVVEGRPADASRLLSTPSTTFERTTDVTTGWRYVHFGEAAGGVVRGILRSIGDVQANATLGDDVVVDPTTFIPLSGEADAALIAQTARGVLDELMAVGATIHLLQSPSAGRLRTTLRRHLLDKGFVETEPNSSVFVPQPRAVKDQQTAAFHSRLQAPTVRTSTNRVLIELSPMNLINENSIYSINGGIGALESVVLAETVQTARYAGYGPQLSSEAGQREHLVNTLLPVLRSDAGRAYLAAQSGVVDDAGSRSLSEAIDRLIGKLLDVRDNPRAKLLPEAGQEFGSGDLIPLVSYNERNELVGVHLYRHGHMPVAEALLHGASLPEGNAALGVRGVRLTIDQGRVDDAHTTHRGEVTQFEWLGMQGAILHLRANLTDLGSKVFERLTGMKWTTSPAPSDMVLPSHPIFAGMPVVGAGDLASPTAKTSDGWWLSTPSRIIEAVGFDVMPYLARALRGVDFATAGAEQFAVAERDVRDLLRAFSRQHGGALPPQTVVSAQDAETEDAFLALLAQWLDSSDIDLDFSASTTGPELADVTMLQLVLRALTAGATLDSVLGAPGYVDQPRGSRSHTMHPVFTTLLHRLPLAHPARLAFVEQINSRMPWDNGNGYELRPDFTWTRHVQTPRGHVAAPAMLAFTEMRNTDTNDALSEMATERKIRGSVSNTTLAMAYTTLGASAMLDAPLVRGAEVFAESPSLKDEASARSFYFNPGVSSSPFTARFTDELRLNAAEVRHITTKALPSRRALSVPIDTTAWFKDMSKAERRTKEQAYRREFTATLRALRLTDQDAIYLTEMLRSVLARPATAEGQAEFLSLREAMAGLKLIKSNALTKRTGASNMPTHGGAVNTLSRAAAQRLYEVGYPLRRGDGTAVPVSSWDEWVEAVLSETFSDDPSMRGYPAVSNIIDGLLYEYRGDVPGLQATVNTRLAGVFSATRTRSGLLIASPVARRMMDDPSVMDGDVLYDAEDFASASWEYDELPQDARALVDKRMTEWENSRGLRRRRQSPRRNAIRGEFVREGTARTNVALRFMQLGFVLKSLINPGLWVSAFIELGLKATQEKVVSFLAGENVGAQQFTDAQRQQWEDTVTELANSSTFYSQVYSHTNFSPDGAPETRLEARIQRATNFATAAINDPTWGASSKGLARAFMEAAWATASSGASERAVTVEQFLDTLSTGPENLRQISSAAVDHGYSRIEYRRNLQDNLAERSRRYVVEGIIGSGGPTVNTLGTLLLRFPTLFFRFRSNTLINLAGLQGPHAVLVALLSDRTRRPGGLFSKSEEPSDTARMEDSYDLTRAIIRSGVSHTQLLMLGMMLGAGGFGGDDDEEQLLNKLRRFQVPLVANDPRELESDFRNAEAWFNDMLPAGIGVPSWVIRPFVSPAMGVARFAQTGDWRQVLWGFEDALGSMPLLNVDTVMNSWDLANELAAAAAATSREDSDEATAEAGRLLFTAVAVLEAMMFESAFASMVYQGADEWDRDPYKMPLRDSDGDIQRFANGLPRPAEMLDEYVDENGEVRQGYSGRNAFDAQMRQLAENRPTAAFLMSLIMQDSTFLRYNMVPKTREIDAAELTEEEAGTIVMSVFNNELGGEQLTAEGAEAVIRGVHLGTVRLDSPALGGIFIPKEMRFEIQEKLLGELTNRYIDLGFSKSEALNKAKEEWYGQAYGEAEGLGLADILWSDRIPSYQTQTYLQLNTTYVMGPNNRPIATGLQRSVLDSVGMNLQGMGVFQTYENGGASNMPTDSLLNSQDLGRGMNLGQRALVKVDDESWIPPTDEEIGQSITAALDKISDQLDDLSDNLNGGFTPWSNRGYGGYSRRGGYGGGGGGYTSRADYGGQPQRLNTPRGFDMPYSLSPRQVNTSNPIIRRATVRRERFSSQRGRLNQWQ